MYTSLLRGRDAKTELQISIQLNTPVGTRYLESASEATSRYTPTSCAVFAGELKSEHGEVESYIEVPKPGFVVYVLFFETDAASETTDQSTVLGSLRGWCWMHTKSYCRFSTTFNIDLGSQF